MKSAGHALMTSRGAALAPAVARSEKGNTAARKRKSRCVDLEKQNPAPVRADTGFLSPLRKG